MSEKKELRKYLLEKRKNLSELDKKTSDNEIVNKLIELVLERKPLAVHTFLPLEEELNLYPFIDFLLDKNIFVVTSKTLPNRELEHLVLKNIHELEVGLFKTKFPKNAERYNGNFDLIIVPGLAFDNQNYRLGYGKGYYDSFLNQYPTAYKVGVCYPFQLVEKVPIEPHDAKLDKIIC